MNTRRLLLHCLTLSLLAAGIAAEGRTGNGIDEYWDPARCRCGPGAAGFPERHAHSPRELAAGHPYLRLSGTGVRPRQPALPDVGRRNALSAHPARVLEGPPAQGASPGPEHRLHLCLLEPAGARAREVGLYGPQRPGRLHQDGGRGRALGRRPSRPLRLRRVGLRRSSDLASAHPRHQSPLPRPPLYGRLRALYRQAGRPAAAAPGPQGRPRDHGPDRERVRQLRQRPRLYAGAQGDVGKGPHRNPLLYRGRCHALYARSRLHPRLRHRARPGRERQGVSPRPKSSAATCPSSAASSTPGG